jgi:hypothetical protein
MSERATDPGATVDADTDTGATVDADTDTGATVDADTDTGATVDADTDTGASAGSETGLDVDIDPDAAGPQAFMQALRVGHNARLGVVVGVAATVVVFVLFVVIPGAGRSPLWYVSLGFVLALSTAGLVAAVLTLARAVRLSRDL